MVLEHRFFLLGLANTWFPGGGVCLKSDRIKWPHIVTHESAAFRLEKKKSVQEVTVKIQRNFKQIIWQPSPLFYQVEMALGALELIRKME